MLRLQNALSCYMLICQCDADGPRLAISTESVTFLEKVPKKGIFLSVERVNFNNYLTLPLRETGLNAAGKND